MNFTKTLQQEDVENDSTSITSLQTYPPLAKGSGWTCFALLTRAYFQVTLIFGTV